ncbi:MAG: hypothetical protein ACOVOV_17895 [Dolichospermum sp.]
MKTEIKEVYNQLKAQADRFGANGGIMVMEFERDYNGSVEWFAVDIEVTEKGVEFSFDQDGYPTTFDGDIVGSDNFYCLPFDEYFSDLDSYLQRISENITEGYLLSNNIMAGE